MGRYSRTVSSTSPASSIKISRISSSIRSSSNSTSAADGCPVLTASPSLPLSIVGSSSSAELPSSDAVSMSVFRVVDRASARSISSPTSPSACPSRKSLISAGIRLLTSSIRLNMSSVGRSVWSITRLSRFSTDHASSPMLVAPTSRPLPLRVWNARRTSVSASRSSWF